MRSYAVIASDNLRKAYEKGEIKDRYWNPGNIFDFVHVLVLADEDIVPCKVQRVAGNAKFYIHPVGRLKFNNIFQLRELILNKITKIRPDIIRGHGPLLQGYYAVFAAKKKGIPSFVSIHDDMSIYRRFWTYGKGYYKMTAYQLMLKTLGWEKFVYEKADRLVPKYVAAGRLLNNSKYRHKVEVIYNQVFLENFRDLEPSFKAGETLRIINVGRQFLGKDQRPLIKALRGINAELTLIGKGPLHGELIRTAKKFGVSEKVHFFDSVPNHKLPEKFKKHHLFSINIIQPGVCMPVMEAMALGFPIVINKPRWEEKPEVCGDCACVIEGTPESYTNAFQQFLDRPGKIRQMGKISRQVIREYSGEKMEEKEKNLILSLLGKYQS